MDARTRLKSRLPRRHVTEGPERVPREFRAIAFGIEFTLCDGAEVFKRTRYAADLKPAGRHVAKDMFEADAIAALQARKCQESEVLRGAVTHRGGAGETSCYADI